MGWTTGLLFWLALATTLSWRGERWALAIAEAGLLAQAAAWALVKGTRCARLRGGFPLAVLALAGAWMAVLASTSSSYRFQSIEALARWAVLAAIYLLGRQIFADARSRKLFLRGFLIFGIATAALAIAQQPTSKGKFLWLFDSGFGDLIGPFANRNHFAMLVELLMPMVIWRSVRSREDRGTWLAVAAGLWIAVAASASRAGTLLVSAELAVLFLLVWRRRLLPGRTLASGAIAVALVTVSGGLLLAWEPLWRRVASADVLGYRADIYRSTLSMVAARPLTGFGPGTFENVYPAFARFDIGQIVNHAHNDWLEAAAEGGLPLLALLIVFAAWHTGPAVRHLWALGIIAVMLHAMVDYPLERLGVAGWLFAMLAAVAATESGKSEKLELSWRSRLPGKTTPPSRSPSPAAPPLPTP